jgi:hypothetical protein
LQRLWAEVEDKNKKLAQLTKESNELEKQVQVSPFSVYMCIYITIISLLNNFKLNADIYVTHPMLTIQKALV